MNKLKNKNHLSMTITILILMLVSIGISYAYWKFSTTQNDLNVASTNCFSLTYTDNTDSLILDNIVPTEDEEGLNEKGYSFTIKNTCNTTATYEVNLEDILSSSDIKHMPNKYIKVSLNDSTPKVLNTYEEVKTTISNATSSFKLTSGSLKPEEEATYELKLWMDSETPAIDEVMSATFESKITVNTSYIEEENLANDITIMATSQNEDYSKENETFMINITSTNKNIIEYSFNNQNWTSVTPSKEVKFSYDFTEEKSYTLYVKDEIGNVKTIEITPDKLDQTSPEINIETTNNQESYNLTIRLTDEKSGVNSYQITTTKEVPTNWLTYTDTIEKEIMENNTYYVWSKDKVGNINYKTIVVDKIDKISPTITLSNTLTEWGIKDTIQIHLTDDIIGLSGYQIMTSEKEPTDYISLDNSLEENLTYDVTENGTYYVYAKDAYNHVSHKEITIDKIDNELPSQSFDIESSILGENNWYQSLSIKVTVSDNQSGVLNSQYCITTEESCIPNISAIISNNGFDITLGTNIMPQKLCVNTTDKLGNISNTTCSLSYYVDTINPIAQISAFVSESNITVSANGSTDVGSGIQTYYYSKDGGNTFVSSFNNYYTFVGLADGTYILVIKVVDNSGRVSNYASTSVVVNNGAIVTNFVTNLNGNGQVLADDPAGNPRYIGANPNNYVWFNDELWRIIGVFNVPEGKRVKLIRMESIGTLVWDYNSRGGYTNNWWTSSLKDLLNYGAYYNRTSQLYYNSSKTPITLDYSGIGLTVNARNLIDTVTWNIGGTSNYYDEGYVYNWYNYERGAEAIAGYPVTWQGQVGLMYPSDYGYATGGGATTSRAECFNTQIIRWANRVTDCYQNNWLYGYNNGTAQWTMTHDTENSLKVFSISPAGGMGTPGSYMPFIVRPVVYLKSTVKIIGGYGTSGSPYILG